MAVTAALLACVLPLATRASLDAAMPPSTFLYGLRAVLETDASTSMTQSSLPSIRLSWTLEQANGARADPALAVQYSTSTDSTWRAVIMRTAAACTPSRGQSPSVFDCVASLPHDWPRDVDITTRARVVDDANADDAWVTADNVVRVPSEVDASGAVALWLRTVSSTSAAIDMVFMDSVDCSSDVRVEARVTTAAAQRWTTRAAAVTRTSGTSGSSSTCSVLVSELGAGMSHVVQLRSYRGWAWSTWSADVEFATLPNPPPPPTLLEMEASDVGHDRIRVCWSGDATTAAWRTLAYTVQVRQGRSFASPDAGWKDIALPWNIQLVDTVIEVSTAGTVQDFDAMFRCDASWDAAAHVRRAWATLHPLQAASATAFNVSMLSADTGGGGACRYCVTAIHLSPMRVHQFRVRQLVTINQSIWVNMSAHHSRVVATAPGLESSTWSSPSSQVRTRPIPSTEQSNTAAPRSTAEEVRVAASVTLQQSLQPVPRDHPVCTESTVDFDGFSPSNCTSDGYVTVEGWTSDVETVEWRKVIAFAGCRVAAGDGITSSVALPRTNAAPHAVAVLVLSDVVGTVVGRALRVRLVARGADGGNAGAAVGGRGARVDVMLRLYDTDVLAISLGHAGVAARLTAAGSGGWPDGGAGGEGTVSGGGGGGGSTSVYSVPSSMMVAARQVMSVPQQALLYSLISASEVPLVTAAGGGGAGNISAGGAAGVCRGEPGALTASDWESADTAFYPDTQGGALQTTRVTETVHGGGGASTPERTGGVSGNSSASSVRARTWVTANAGAFQRGGVGAGGFAGGGGGGGGLYGGGGGGAGLYSGAGGGGGSSYVHSPRLWRGRSADVPAAPSVLRVGRNRVQLQLTPFTFAAIPTQAQMSSKPAASTVGASTVTYAVEIAEGAASEEYNVVTSTPATSIALTLNFSTEYRIRYVARDVLGSESSPSLPVAVSTGPFVPREWKAVQAQIGSRPLNVTRLQLPTTDAEEDWYAPPALRGASLVAIDNWLYLYGGLSLGRDCTDSQVPFDCRINFGVQSITWRLDVRAMRWDRLPIAFDAVPPPRERHVAAAMQGSMYILSGRQHPDSTRDGGPYLTDMWRLDTNDVSTKAVTTTVSGSCIGILQQGSGNMTWLQANSSGTDGALVLLPLLVDSAVVSGRWDAQCVDDIEVYVEVVHPCFSQLRVSLLGPGLPFHASAARYNDNAHAMRTSLAAARADASLSNQEASTWLAELDGRISGEAMLFDGPVSAGADACSSLSDTEHAAAYRVLTSPPRMLGFTEDNVMSDITSSDRAAFFTDAGSSSATVESLTATLPATRPPAATNTCTVAEETPVWMQSLQRRVPILRGIASPVDSLSGFRRRFANGTWFLRVLDTSADGRSAIVVRWGISIRSRACSTNYMWVNMTVPALPPARTDAASVVYRDSWYVWGGRGSGGLLFSEIPDGEGVWRFTAGTWKLLPRIGDGAGGVKAPWFTMWPQVPAGAGPLLPTAAGWLTWSGYTPRTSAGTMMARTVTSTAREGDSDRVPVTIPCATTDVAAEAASAFGATVPACFALEQSVRAWNPLQQSWSVMHPPSLQVCAQNTSAAPCRAPYQRAYHGVAWVPAQTSDVWDDSIGAVWVYGGQDAHSGEFLGDLWTLAV